MKIAFVCPWRVSDERGWSGTVHPMYRALAARADVEPVEMAHASHAWPDRIGGRLGGRGALGSYLPDWGVATAQARSRLLSERLRDMAPDAVLSVAASHLCYRLESPAPVTQVTDTTLHGLLGYYPGFSSLSACSRRQALAIEADVVARSTSFVTATQWAADQLLRHYHVPPDRIRVVPFGPGTNQPVDVPERVPGDGPRLLVVASDWDRKDGDRAVRLASLVRQRVPSTRLTVVGDAPPLPRWITVHGRMSRTELARTYRDSDLLLELTRANCAGVVLTDAAAAGLACLASRTGGVPEVVVADSTGILADLDESDEALASGIVTAWESGRLPKLGRAARTRFLDVLNWDVWADAVLNHLGRRAG